MKRNLFRKLVVAVMVMCMVVGGSTVSFAGVSHEDGLTIKQLSDEKFVLSDGGESAAVDVSETSTKLKVELTSLSGNDADNGYFLFNKETGVIYSSFTGESILAEDVIVEDETTLAKQDGISQAAAAKKVAWSKTYKVSYAKLAKLCGSASSNRSIATAIIICIATASGVTISTTAVVVSALISGQLAVIQAGLKTKSPKHGIRATVNKVEIRKHQGGRVVKGYSYTISKVGTY